MILLHVRVAVAVNGAHLWVRDSIPWTGCWRKWEEGDAAYFRSLGCRDAAGVGGYGPGTVLREICQRTVLQTEVLSG